MALQLKEEMDILVKEKRLTIEELKELLAAINEPWEEVRGTLKKKKINALKYQKKIRCEWAR